MDGFVIEEVAGRQLIFGLSWLRVSGSRAQRKREFAELVRTFNATHYLSHIQGETESIGVLNGDTSMLGQKVYSAGQLLAKSAGGISGKPLVMVRALRGDQQVWICVIENGLVAEGGERVLAWAALPRAVEEILASFDRREPVEFLLDGVKEVHLGLVNNDRIVLRTGALGIIIDGAASGEAKVRRVGGRDSLVWIGLGAVATLLVAVGLGLGYYYYLASQTPAVVAAPPPDPNILYSQNVISEFNAASHLRGGVLVKELDRVLNAYPLIRNGWMTASARCAGSGCQMTYRRLPFAQEFPTNPGDPELKPSGTDLESGSHGWRIPSTPFQYQGAGGASEFQTFFAGFSDKDALLPFFRTAVDYGGELTFAPVRQLGAHAPGASFGVQEHQWTLKGDVLLLPHLAELPQDAVLTAVEYTISEGQQLSISASGVYWKMGAHMAPQGAPGTEGSGR